MNDSELNNNLQSPNYLICDLYGFENLTLYDNQNYIINNELIKYISIDDNLKSMYVELQDNITYSGNEQKIRNYLYHICFNLIIKTEVYYYTPVYLIKSIRENDKPIIMNDRLELHEKIKMASSFPAQSIYHKIIDSPTNIEENFMKYERIFKTLHNNNTIVQFMSLYQFLMELLQGVREHPSQRAVTNYLKDNEEKYDFLYFKPSRKEGSNFDEDCFTYIRNEIGHSEETNDLNLYKQLGSQITQKLIKDLIIVINDVIIDS